MTGTRSAAQIAAMRRWRAAYPEQFDVWVQQKKSRVDPPEAPPRPLFDSHMIGPMGMVRDRIEVRQSWRGGPLWAEIVEWINDPGNMRTFNGKTSRFSYRRKGRATVFSFTQPDVGFAFKMRFG